MYLASEDLVCFQKVKGIQSIKVLDKLPNDARLIDVQNELIKIWTTLKEKTDKETYRKHKRSLQKRFTNFNFYLNGKRDPPLTFFRSLQNIIKKCGLDFNLENNIRVRFGHGGNAATAELPTVITPQLVYLVGAMRDGTLSRYGKYEISYSQKNEVWLKVIQKLLKDVFRPSNAPVIRNDRVTLSNRPIFEYLHRIFGIPIGKKDQWATPKIIKQCSLELQRYYIRGFYDADGLSWKLGFCQINRDAIVFVKNTLEKLGIRTGKLSVRKLKGKNPLYSFNTSKQSHRDFIKLIGSLNPSKQKLFLPT